MKYFDKIFNKDKIIKKFDKIIVVYENDCIKHEVDEWVKHVGRENLSDILLEIGFNPGDKIYLYSNGRNYFEFYYSVNEENENSRDTIKLTYGTFRDSGYGIIFENDSKMVLYSKNRSNKFEIDTEKIYVSDNIEYTRNYYLEHSVMWFNCYGSDNDYILRLCIFKNLDVDEIFKLDNEMELEEYFNNLKLPCNLVDVYKKIIEICNIDLNEYDSFNLELYKKINRYGREIDSEVISHIKFISGEFKSISYIKDGNMINYNESGNWSYKKIDLDNDVKLSIEVKNNRVDCNINSDKDSEIDSYFRDNIYFDIVNARCEIEDVKKLVKTNFNR